MRWSPGCICCGDGTVLTACCLLDGNQLSVPSGSIADTNCSLPDFGNLVAELNGFTADVFESGCSGGGSVSLPNSAACHIAGTTGGPGGSASGSCVWSGKFPFTTSGGADCVTAGLLDPWEHHVVVVAMGGHIYGTVGGHRGSACNSNGGFGSPNYALIAQFDLSHGVTPVDLSGPVNIPCVLTSGVWDIGVPLVVYF